MPLFLQIISSAKLPILAGIFGLCLNFGAEATPIRNTGAAITYLSIGAGVASASKRNSCLSEVQTLIKRHQRDTEVLAAARDKAKKEADEFKRVAEAHYAQLQKAGDAIAQLQLDLNTREANLAAATDAAKSLREDNSSLAGDLHLLQEERMNLIYELYETLVTEVELAKSIADLESQFDEDKNQLANDKEYQLNQTKKAKSALTKARANFHTELAEAHERIEELEDQLAEKTQLADQMMAELNRDANQQLQRFGNKAQAQGELITSLQRDLEEKRKDIKALTLVRFDNVGGDNIRSNRLIDALAKRGLIYAAHHNERAEKNGRLKVLLKLVDTTIKGATDALPDLEAELSLFAKPTVEVKSGMHLFTLAVEQEHRVLEAPNVPLSRLEKTLDTAMHVRVVGGSGSGKTCLVNNLMHYMAHSMPGANVTLLDPKAVDDWGSFIPKYWGEECVTGIVDLADGLKWRVSDTVKHRKAGKPAPTYDPELFVVDEAQYNYILAQNADKTHIKERGEKAPEYATKAKGALASLLCLGRAYNAIGIFVTQLPQVSKVGLNEGSFDPCVNIFLGVQIDNAIASFLPPSGYTEAQCKRLTKDLATRRQLGQEWLMLVADLPRSEAYIMECPAPNYYHNRFSRVLGGSTKSAETGETEQSPAQPDTETGSELASGSESAADQQANGSDSAAKREPSAHCPQCSHLSIKTHGSKPKGNGKYRFICENPACEKGAKKGTFSAHPLA